MVENEAANLREWGTWYWIKYLTTMIDQNRISSHNIYKISSRKVMRLRKNINQGIINWTNFITIVWQTVWKISYEILGVRALIWSCAVHKNSIGFYVSISVVRRPLTVVLVEFWKVSHWMQKKVAKIAKNPTGCCLIFLTFL